MNSGTKRGVSHAIFLAVLFFYISLATGCGIVGDGVNHLRTVQLDPGPLYSKEFYSNASPEDVRRVIGKRSLADESFRKKEFGKDTGGFLGDLKKAIGVFIPASYVYERGALYPLQVAVWHTPHPEVVRIMLDAGADPATVPLPYYATNGRANPGVTAVLLERGTADARCRTLIEAARQGDRELVDHCLGFADVSPNCTSGNSWPLAGAFEGKQNAIAAHLLERGATLPADADGQLRLLGATLRTGNAEGFHMLAALGADASHVGSSGGNTLLRDARRGGITDETILKKLAETVPLDGKSGFSALETACAMGRADILDTLVKRGGGLPESVEDRLDLLEAALAGGQPAIFQKLVGLGADSSGQTSWGGNDLMAAAWRGEIRDGAVLEHLARTVPVDAANGPDALRYACRIGDARTVELLLARGASPRQGTSVAVRKQSPDSAAIRALLEEKGFSVREW